MTAITPEEDEISICDNCGREFGFSTGVAVYNNKHEVLFLCPEDYKEWPEDIWRGEMREIKFRAWNTDKKYMTPSFSIYKVNLFEDDNKHDWLMLQYTGLKDKNGKEIYESDVVRFTWLIDKTYEVKWNNETHEWQLHNREMSKYIEIIGNIYEHPELIDKDGEEN